MDYLKYNISIPVTLLVWRGLRFSCPYYRPLTQPTLRCRSRSDSSSTGRSTMCAWNGCCIGRACWLCWYRIAWCCRLALSCSTSSARNTSPHTYITSGPSPSSRSAYSCLWRPTVCATTWRSQVKIEQTETTISHAHEGSSWGFQSLESNPFMFSESSWRIMYLTEL